jgi:acyl-CoA oxidase
LEDLARVFAISCVERDLSWYLTESIVTVATGSKVTDLSRQATMKLAPQSLNLIAAFDIPEHLIQAPIAHNWAKYNEVDNKGKLTRL